MLMMIEEMQVEESEQSDSRRKDPKLNDFSTFYSSSSLSPELWNSLRQLGGLNIGWAEQKQASREAQRRIEKQVGASSFVACSK